MPERHHPSTLRDWALPAGLLPAPSPAGDERRAHVDADLVQRAITTLEGGIGRQRRVTGEQLIAAWEATITALLDPTSGERRRLDPQLAAASRLTPPALQAALEVTLGGLRGEPLRRLADHLAATPAGEPGVRLVVLAATPPGLAAQPLLPLLLRDYPVLLKSSASEPWFAPALVDALGRRLPALAPGLAALSWSRGDAAVNTAAVGGAARVIAYGGEAAIAGLGALAGDRLVAYGPRLSIALVAADADPDGNPDTMAAGLARDIALCEQRGCLSLHAVYLSGDVDGLARALVGHLARLAATLPPVAATLAERAAVAQQRALAELAGGRVLAVGDTIEAGTVIIAADPALAASPGLRCVTLHPVSRLDEVIRHLIPWIGRLQGAALAGRDAWRLAPELSRLGVSHLAPAGTLQAVDACWKNGGIDPASAY